jgi:hypothetical protein
MSEIDRLSNSGTYQALPISAKRRTKEDPRPPFSDPTPEHGEKSESAAPAPRLPKSIIDEFA